MHLRIQRHSVCAALVMAVGLSANGVWAADYALKAAPIGAVKIEGGFWGARLETNRNVTLPHIIKQVEDAGEIDNYSKAAGAMPGEFRGWPDGIRMPISSRRVRRTC